MKNILFQLAIFAITTLSFTALNAAESWQYETSTHYCTIESKSLDQDGTDWLVFKDIHGNLEVIDDGCYSTVLTFEEDIKGNWIPTGGTSPCGQCNC